MKLAKIFDRIYDINSLQIFLISFLILFSELAIIRWINASILSIGFYSNLIMLASFFGIGIGCLFFPKKNLFNLFPILILILSIVLFLGLFGIMSSDSSDKQMIMFQNQPDIKNSIPTWLISLIFFVFVATIFIPLGHKLKLCFENCTSSINAYILDLSGSLCGIAIFSLLSFFEIGLICWIIIISILWYVIYLLDKTTKKFDFLIIWFFVLTISSLSQSSFSKSWWSKYYFITLEEYKNNSGFFISTNQTGHQEMTKDIASRAWFYNIPYNFFANSEYDNILIIGAGSGQDVSAGILNKVRHIDAVDIEPRIVEIGKQYHPLKPYKNHNVDIHIADGRNFLENQKNKKYDLIIFALTDSLRLSSNNTNTRLESYLLTTESFAKAKSLLSENGMLILYNYYRKEWLVEKLTKMMINVFGDKVLSIYKKPISIESGSFMAVGNKVKDFDEKKLLSTNIYEFEYKDISSVNAKNQISQDDWPFAYLLKRTIPDSYKYITLSILTLAFIALILFIYQLKQQPQNINITLPNFLKSIPWHMFFLGAGFMLLEAKNIINFQLLFGSTWAVNSLVFIAIIGLALISAILTKIKIIPNKKLLYILMIASIALSIFLPLKSVIEMPFYQKFFSAITISILPVFFANLIFSNHFSSQKNPQIAFGLNMIGALIGGILEYLSMLTGYHFLLYIIAICYFLAIISAEIFHKKLKS